MSQTILGTFFKQPAEVESYTINYTDDLADEQDHLSTATAVVEPAGLLIDSTFVFDPRVRLFISGGTDGTTYKVTVTAQTTGGRTLEDEFKVKVKEV
jgi:hypothetical protein